MTKDPVPWKTIEETLHASCKVFDIYRRHCRHPGDNREGDFYIIDCADWVQVLALTPERDLVLVQQYRFGSNTLSWEMPGGIIDNDDGDPLTAGLRELLEETGYQGENPRLLGWCHPNPAIMTNRTHFVLVENVRQVAGQSLDPHEELLVRTFPIPEAFSMVRDGRITHSIAINALFHLADALQLWK